MRIARRIVEWLLVLSGLPRLARRMNRRKTLILVYHGVHGGPPDPVLNFDGMHVRARRFARQMRYVARHYRVVGLDTVLDGAGPARSERPDAVITIDDGYQNIYWVAHPVLKRLNLPATLFVPTDFVQRRRGLWWDRLRVMVDETRQPTLRFSVDGVQRVRRIDTVKDQRAVLMELTHELRRLSPRRREQALDALAASLGVSGREAGALGAPLTVEETRALADGGVTIGSHGISHDSFLHLNWAALSREVQESKHLLESLTGRRVDWLAYPYGDFSDDAMQAAKQAGYRGAVTTIEALNDQHANPYALRRIGVHDNMTLAHFIVATSGLRDFVLGVVAAAKRRWHRRRQ